MFFLISYFLKINTFSAQLLSRRSFFSRISNYSEYVLFRSRYLFWTPTFSQEEPRSRYFLKTVTFSEKLVLRKQFHRIYTSKSFPLTSIHSFKYSMVRSDFEIPQPFIVENSKQRINFNCVKNMAFWEPANFGIFKQTSKNSPALGVY